MVANIKNNNPLSEYLDKLKRKYPLNNKVLLVQNLQFDIKAFNSDVARNRGYYAYPPNNFLCLIKSIKELNLEIKILDLNYELLKRINNNKFYDYKNWLSILKQSLRDYKPSIVGVSCTSVSNLFEGGHPFIQILEYLKEHGKEIVLTGGVNTTNSYKELLEKELCHFVFKGESEDNINSFFNILFNLSKETIQLPGVFFKTNGKIENIAKNNKFVELKGNLVDVYKNIPVEKYHEVGSLNPYSRMAGLDKKYATIQLVRGCRGNCIFCGVAKFNGRMVRHFPVKDVVEEIIYLVKERGIEHFEWLDDDPLVFKDCFEDILKEIINKKLDITWAANNGLVATSLDEELLGLMRDSGCIGFKIGIESGNPEILKMIRKPTSIYILRRASVMLQKFPELFVGGSYIIGFANESFSQILDTFKFSCEMNLDWSSISVCQFQSWGYSPSITVSEKLKKEASFDFIPAKESSKDELLAEEGILSGPDVFNIPKDHIPSREQLKQIWFTLNLVGNYINNKNLKPGGRPKQFVSWLESLQATYPDNPYMCLFASLGYVLLENKAKVVEQYERSKKILANSKYWQHRFKQFELDKVIDSFPKRSEEVHDNLEILQKKFVKWPNGRG